MNFVVTTSARGVARKQIWEPKRPLTLGFPMQWLMEATATGIRITYLGGDAGTVVRDLIQEITYAELKKSPKLSLKGARESILDLSITPARTQGEANIIKLPTIEIDERITLEHFKKSLQIAAGALTALIVLSFVWP